MICPSCGITISPYVTRCNHCKKQISSAKSEEPANKVASKAPPQPAVQTQAKQSRKKSKPKGRASHFLRNIAIVFFIIAFVMRKLGTEFNLETLQNLLQPLPTTVDSSADLSQQEQTAPPADSPLNEMVSHQTLAAYSTANGQLEIARQTSGDMQYYLSLNGINIFTAPVEYIGVSVAAFWPKNSTPFLYLMALSTGNSDCPVLFRILDVRSESPLTDEFGNCSNNPAFKYLNGVLTLTFNQTSSAGKVNPKLTAEYSEAGLRFQSETTSAASNAGMAALYEQGRQLANKGNFAAALAIWKPLAENGYAEAQYALGRMYARGDGVTRDFTVAKKWFTAAARQGHQASIDKLKLMSERGDS